MTCDKISTAAVLLKLNSNDLTGGVVTKQRQLVLTIIFLLMLSQVSDLPGAERDDKSNKAHSVMQNGRTRSVSGDICMSSQTERLSKQSHGFDESDDASNRERRSLLLWGVPLTRGGDREEQTNAYTTVSSFIGSRGESQLSLD